MTTNHLILLVICYFWINIGLVAEDLQKSPLHRPFWALHPSLGKIILMTITYLPSQLIFQIINQQFATCIIRLFAVLSIYGYFWIIYTILNLWLNNPLALLTLTPLIVLITTPLMTILMIIPSLIIGSLLRLLHVPNR